MLNVLQGLLEKSDHNVQIAVESRGFTRSYPGSCQVETLIFTVIVSVTFLGNLPQCVTVLRINNFFLHPVRDFLRAARPVYMNPCEESNPIFSIGTFWSPEVSAELSVSVGIVCFAPLVLAPAKVPKGTLDTWEL